MAAAVAVAAAAASSACLQVVVVREKTVAASEVVGITAAAPDLDLVMATAVEKGAAIMVAGD